MSKEKKIYVVGIGPGSYEGMTGAAATALEKSDVIVGYTVYIDLVKDHFPGKSFLTTPMRKEVDRCVMAFDEAMKDQTVSMICSGDAGVYGMAGLMYEIGANYPEVELEVVAGVTAATGGAAVLGAPLIHDFCLISLSDLLTPWEHKSPETVCGTVQNINREGETARAMTLAELKETQVDMFTTVFIGNSQTRNIDGKMVTPRGYKNV